MMSPYLVPTVAMLREISLLQPLTESELMQLIQLGTGYEYESHSNIVIEGEMTWGLFLLLEGLVGIYKNNKLTGNSYDIGQLAGGSFFGEMSLVDDHPRSATVKALTDCKVFYISREQFQTFLDRSRETKINFFSNCIKLLVKRLRDLDDKYVISQFQLWKSALSKEGSS